MEDRVTSMLEPGAAQRGDGAFGRELCAARNQTQRNDALRPGARLLFLRNGLDERGGLRSGLNSRRLADAGLGTLLAARHARKHVARHNSAAPEVYRDQYEGTQPQQYPA